MKEMHENKIKAPAFQFYAQDFLTGVMYLTNEEIGIYIKMLAKQWTDGKIPKKRLGFLVGLEWDKLSDELRSKFTESEDFVINERLEKEREKSNNFRKRQSENGKKGGRPPKDKGFEEKKEINPSLSGGLSQKKPLEDEDEDRSKNKDKEVINKKEDQKIIEFFNSTCTRLSKVQILSDVRKKKIAARLHEVGYDKLTQIITEVSNSDFLNGDNPRGWTADFDWILEPRNFTKILEGNYKNKNNGSYPGYTNHPKPNTGKISGHQFIAGKLRELSARDSESGDNTIDIEAFEVK